MEKNCNVLLGYECPKCESQGPFELAVSIYGKAIVDDDGWSQLESSSTEFPDNGYARCLTCYHETIFSRLVVTTPIEKLAGVSENLDEEYEEEGEPSYGMSEREREMGMAFGNRGLADYGGLDTSYGGCDGHACHGCHICEGPEEE